MGYNDLKKHDGKLYTGMQVGGRHTWYYSTGVWKETKMRPDRWNFEYQATKGRQHPAPEGSGAKLGTRYHWYIVASQYVEKTSKDRYTTRMHGRKYKVGHRRPHWKKPWSNDYPENDPKSVVIERILRDEIDRAARQVDFR
jgi:hypothetical protein